MKFLDWKFAFKCVNNFPLFFFFFFAGKGRGEMSENTALLNYLRNKKIKKKLNDKLFRLCTAFPPKNYMNYEECKTTQKNI